MCIFIASVSVYLASVQLGLDLWPWFWFCLRLGPFLFGLTVYRVMAYIFHALLPPTWGTNANDPIETCPLGWPHLGPKEAKRSNGGIVSGYNLFSVWKSRKPFLSLYQVVESLNSEAHSVADAITILQNVRDVALQTKAEALRTEGRGAKGSVD